MRNNLVYLRHIRDAIEKVEKYLGDTTFEVFSQNDMMVDAVVRELEIIGEAARNLSDEFCEKHSRIWWSSIRGMRNVLIHEYFGIDLNIIWDTCKNNLPELRNFVVMILGDK
ncbi:hypothetical protein LCGC14_2530730 [marine sediment metagenome]|uniref:DUF86 domain-containing protein n=1 Tax=marine sediment metagenome TaxID=412755 RepID=A0A0F9D546_9ZZZZ